MADSQSTTPPTNDVSRRLAVKAGLGIAVAGISGTGIWLGRTDTGIATGRSRARPVQGDPRPPEQVDVVVIGGGFVGTSAALTLAERGVSVVLCEKGVIAGEASGRSMGFVDSQFCDPIKAPLISRSKTLWHTMNERAGTDTGYRMTGLVATLSTADDIAGAEAWLESVAHVPNMEGHIIRGAEIASLLPGMVKPPLALLNTTNDASVEPQLAAPAIADGARLKGAKIVQNCAVRGLEMSGGHISGVVTEKGRIKCSTVILAGGAWSSLFASSLGLSLPQFQIYMSMLSFDPIAGAPKVPLSGDGYGFRPQIDGSYSFGTVNFAAPILPETFKEGMRLLPSMKFFWPNASIGLSTHEFFRELMTPSEWPLDRPSPFEERRILMPNFRFGPYEKALKKVKSHFPAFDNAKIKEEWAGVISTTLDNVPVISAVPSHPGLFIGSGFSYGLTMGPAAGEALADLAMNRTTAFDLNHFRLTRFFDGTKMRFHS